MAKVKQMPKSSDSIQQVFEQVAAELNQKNLASSTYVITNFDGFKSINDGEEQVFCLETYLGPSKVAGYEAYGIAQVFHSKYPSMVLLFIVEKSIEDGSLADHIPTYTREVDKTFSGQLIAIMHKAFNSLDPTGENKGQLVQIYNSEMTFDNLRAAAKYSSHLAFTFKKDGQLAQIAVDFHNHWIKLIAAIMGPLISVIGDVHYLPRTQTPSAIEIPIRAANGNIERITNSSTALDEGVKIAIAYLDEHYAKKDTGSMQG